MVNGFSRGFVEFENKASFKQNLIHKHDSIYYECEIFINNCSGCMQFVSSQNSKVACYTCE